MNYIAFNLAVVAILALGACTKKPDASAPADSTKAEEPAPTTDAPSLEGAAKAIDTLAAIDSDAPPASGEERFFGKREFTLISVQTGVEEGDFVEHVRAWGRKRTEIKHATTKFGGFTQSSNTRTINDAAAIAIVDLDTGAVTTTQNPYYDTIVARMRGRSSVEVGKEMMTAMGGRATGEKGAFAGHDCDYWELSGMGARTCVTPWGATLHMSVNMGGMAFERTASEVRLGDGGPDAAFLYDASKAVAAPDLKALMNTMRPQPN